MRIKNLGVQEKRPCKPGKISPPAEREAIFDPGRVYND